MKARVWISVGALAAAGLVTWAVVRPDRVSETNSSQAPAAAGSAARTSAPPTLPGAPLSPAVDSSEPPAAAAPYPVNLDELRTRLPDNRYWELGAPTSDPEVARARAERAKRDNAIFGRIQTGEATEQEIRDYYAERRRISEDYLELALVVLKEKADELPERDRGLFALSAKMHQDRLKQIERDLKDALERRRARQR